MNAGAIPDPYYSEQWLQISDWFCRTSWWYRTEVELPESYRGKRVWLNLDGINYRAEVFVNGAAVGKMAGAFTRGRFDITDKVVSGKNAIAVLIHTMPILREPFDKRLDKVWTAESFNGNAPTFIVAAGWDWAAVLPRPQHGDLAAGLPRHQRRCQHPRSVRHHRPARCPTTRAPI